MAFTALFDACVLYRAPVRDVLISLATTDMFRARWTERIQEEWRRALSCRRPEHAEALLRTQRLMEEAVPDANVTGYEFLIETISLPDQDDRHVLAAAIVGRADVIVTENVKHFPAQVLDPLHIEVQHPDQFISHAFALAPPIALAVIRQLRERLQNPIVTAEEYLDTLSRHGLIQAVIFLRENIDVI